MTAVQIAATKILVINCCLTSLCLRQQAQIVRFLNKQKNPFVQRLKVRSRVTTSRNDSLFQGKSRVVTIYWSRQLINSDCDFMPAWRNWQRKSLVMTRLGVRVSSLAPVVEIRRVHPTGRPVIAGHIGVQPSGKARDFDSLIRRFKSFHPCHKT